MLTPNTIFDKSQKTKDNMHEFTYDLSFYKASINYNIINDINEG
jgi:hypothetical protein